MHVVIATLYLLDEAKIKLHCFWIAIASYCLEIQLNFYKLANQLAKKSHSSQDLAFEYIRLMLDYICTLQRASYIISVHNIHTHTNIIAMNIHYTELHSQLCVQLITQTVNKLIHGDTFCAHIIQLATCTKLCMNLHT